ncbi:hypothetical protein [Pinibacter aurantiacus]|uniref:Uncharacterized protein n=1 Tax=Pinibacter aurantiacus TaxID=2851599 RepID=A0A9E2SF28_9BACT|nr:hypothetical protein [Pinibacter aurantiacus]MBV4360442.1 hypothetical protein [Pinibacter aurantiacus]
MKRIALGDIFEIETPIGTAYLHYIFEDKVCGELIRVFRPQNTTKGLSEIVQDKEAFMIFFPLEAACRKKIVKLSGHFSADAFGKPKYMRCVHSVRGQFLGWFIVDTETMIRRLVEKLSDEEIKYSEWGIWNDTLLIDRIAKNWSLENWAIDLSK